MNNNKYTRSFNMPPKVCMNWAKKTYIDKAPIWCSVDLRDGNQALIIPMSLNEKIEFFKMLVKIGFKQIEIGFPAASDTEYQFCRTLIEKNLIPQDVYIQVLTQSREHIIKRTFEALNGCKNAIVHLYNSTSKVQREQVFHKDKAEITEIAVSGAKLIDEYIKKADGNFIREYSPESFTGTELDYAAEICNAVIDVWKPTPDNKVIINLPVTVQNSMPHIYASQIEYMCEALKLRENLIISLHTHNDRGCGVADSEMGLLAGAERIEGTLFGNGERTGNTDIITLALNMFSQGVDPQLDFSDIPSVIETYEKVTRMKVYERQPYTGQLVFAAFSGSHQDAIAKGMKWRENNKCDIWSVPYLPIDPHDIGREYEGDVIRINSQSGKGGIGYVLETHYGLTLPPKMRESFGYYIKGISDKRHAELLPQDIYKIFVDSFVNIKDRLDITEAHYKQKGEIEATIDVSYKGKIHKLVALGNGRLNACSNALKEILGFDFHVVSYSEHALEKTSKSQAIAYVGIELETGEVVWGAGINTDIINASVNALVSAINRSIK